MRSALITGSDGFIGKHLKKALTSKGVKVVDFSLKNNQDVTHQDSFKDLPKVDLVFHLAAVSGYKSSNKDTNLAYKVNVGGTTNVLEYSKRVGAKLIFPSTYVYDKPYEDEKKELDKTKPTTHYSMTKFLGEDLCRFYSRVFNVDTLILRTSNVFGRGQDDIYLVPVVLNHILKNNRFELTKPDVERSFIYIDDLVEAYTRLALSKTKPGEVFNVGPGESSSLAELVKLLEEVTQKKALVSYTGKDRPHEVDKNRVDITKLKDKLSWEPKINLKRGLRKMIDQTKA